MNRNVKGPGGEWRPVCLRGNLRCVYTFSDGGEPCKSSTDCEGECVYTDSRSPPKCRRTSDPCGCFRVVEDLTEEEIASNRIPIMCVD